MAKSNIARRIPASEVLKNDTAVTSGTVQTEQNETDNTVRDMGTDNPAPDTNQPPVIGNYTPLAETRAEAIHYLWEVVKDMRGAAAKVGTVFDQMSVAIADYGSYWVVANGNKMPTVKQLKKDFMDIATGKIRAVEDAETHQWKVETAKVTSARKAGEKAVEKVKPLKFIDRAAEFMNVNTNTFNLYIEPACQVAILTLMGDDTTYRKGLRYTNHTKDHNIGDPVTMKVTVDGKEQIVPFPMDENQPDNTYIGVIFNDHALHPYLEVEGLPETSWPLKNIYDGTKYTPYRGASLGSAKTHFDRFIGLKTDDKGMPVKAVIHALTGHAPKAVRTPGGTQSEGAKTEEKGTQFVDISKIGNEDFFKQAIVVVKALPKKSDKVSDTLKGFLIDLYRELSELPYIAELDDENGDEEDTISAAMGE